MENQLAIIIPAFKPDFLQKALQSIENQTNKNFQVYIGDDASPHDLQSICQPFVDRNGWNYHRFDHNLGSKNLVQHWNRSVQLSVEPWVWLFSDDDEMADNCVEGFYESLSKQDDCQVFKFNFSIINSASEVIETNPVEKGEIHPFNFGKLRFERQLLTSAVEFIFKRQAWQRENGFISFPAAWCSDDASWMAFSEPKAIQIIPKGLVYWRMSHVNISSLAGNFVYAKLEAALMFIQWFNQKYKSQIQPQLFGEQVIWFRLQLEHLFHPPTLTESLAITLRLCPPSFFSFLRTFNEIYARSAGSMLKKRGLPATGFRDFISRKLPRF